MDVEPDGVRIRYGFFHLKRLDAVFRHMIRVPGIPIIGDPNAPNSTIRSRSYYWTYKALMQWTSPQKTTIALSHNQESTSRSLSIYSTGNRMRFNIYGTWSVAGPICCIADGRDLDLWTDS